MYLQACLGRMDKIQVKNGAGGGGGLDQLSNKQIRDQLNRILVC